MRWAAEKEPRLLETKIVRRFAWIPVQVDTEFIWLRHYYQKYRYEDGGYYNRLCDGVPEKWGDYAGGAQWIEKEVALNIKDIPVYESDNYDTSGNK